jgi:hypothetical protein
MDTNSPASVQLVNKRTLSQYPDGVELIFSRGDRAIGFVDDYRVSFLQPNGTLSTLTDQQFFERFLEYQDNETVLQAVLKITSQISRDTESLSCIDFPEIRGGIEERKLFENYAACLISEEHKRNPKTGALYPLGKKIKVLGAYELLKLGRTISAAANSSKGVSARILFQRYKGYGLPE